MRLELNRVELRFVYEDNNGDSIFCKVNVSGELWDDGFDRSAIMKLAEIRAEESAQALINDSSS